MCRSIFETKCEADEAGVTRCGQEERRICAEDNCVLVEGEEQVNIVIVIIGGGKCSEFWHFIEF